MKRKIITAILAITVVFSAASCGSAENKSSNTQEATVSDTQNSTERVSEAAGDSRRSIGNANNPEYIKK